MTTGARLAFLLALLLAAVPAVAQQPPPAHAPVAAPLIDGAARLRLGPLGLTPGLQVTDVGVDTNVLASSDDPQQDFTAVISPRVDSQLRMRRLHATGSTIVSYRYFGTVTTQRAFDVRQDAGLALSLNRIVPFATGTYGSERRRPNFEIDARVRHVIQRAGIGSELRLGPRLAVVLDAERARLEFEDVDFLGTNLRSELSRRSEIARASLRTDLTPLTTFVVTGEARQDRFEFSPLRDADMVSILPGFELDPVALISGSAFVGYRRFDAKDEALPDFEGVIADVEVGYTLRGRTRFQVRAQRSVEYSAEPLEPYYIQSGGGLTVIQALGGRWDAVGRFGRDNLAYRRILDPRLGESGRRLDRFETYGFGIGRRLGAAARLGLEVNHVERRSIVGGRSFEGWRIGGSFTYGS